MKNFTFFLLFCLSVIISQAQEATLTSSLPATIPAAESTEFTISFTIGATIYVDWDLEANCTNRHTLKLEYNEGSTWNEISFFDTQNASIAQYLQYQNKTFTFRVTPLSEGENAITFYARGWDMVFTTVAEVTSTYTAYGDAPNVITDPISLNFGVVKIGETKDLPLTITPTFCSGELSLSASAGTSCTLSAYTVSATEPTTITVTFTPVYNYNVTGDITISGGGLIVPVYVAVTGTGSNIGITENQYDISIHISNRAITINGIENATFSVYDLVGKEILKTSQTTFQLNHSGVFFINIQKDNFSTTKKIIYPQTP